MSTPKYVYEYRSLTTPEGLFKFKRDHRCTKRNDTCILIGSISFIYKAVPDEDLVYYLRNKGFTDLDFSIERI